MVGLDAEDNDSAGLGGADRLAHALSETAGVADEVVGGKDQHERIRLVGGDP